MNKLHIMATAATLLVAASAPTLAAQRVHRGFDANASASDRSGAYYYGPRDAQSGAFVAPQAATPEQFNRGQQYNRGQNLPYPDRPYGDPDSW
jgi:hypothetical protein